MRNKIGIIIMYSQISLFFLLAIPALLLDFTSQNIAKIMRYLLYGKKTDIELCWIQRERFEDCLKICESIRSLQNLIKTQNPHFPGFAEIYRDIYKKKISVNRILKKYLRLKKIGIILDKAYSSEFEKSLYDEIRLIESYDYYGAK